MKKKNVLVCGIFAAVTLAALLLTGCQPAPEPEPEGGKTLTGIAVTTPPAKIEYNLDEELDTKGMVVTATFSDGTTQAVTGYTTGGYDKTKTGSQTVTVTYQGKTDSFTVNVIDTSKPTVDKPAASPAAGAVASNTSVTLTTTTAGAEIWYTTNGNTPAKNGAGSTKYTTAFAITPPVTVKAIAVKDGMNDSAVLEAAYTLSGTPGHTHIWGEWVQTTAPTCTEAGVETRTCTLDATHTETRPITALGHNWGAWAVTTPAAHTAEGVETRTCTHDAKHTETRAIARIPFADVGSFGTWLTSQPDNTADTPYKVTLKIEDEDDFASLRTTLIAKPDKYVYLDLSDSTVTTIPEMAFFDAETFNGPATLAGIIIPDGVTSIGNSAFYLCTSLASVTIPNNVTSIGYDAFNRCTNLSSVTIGNSVTSIGGRAFFDCASLTSVTIPNRVTSIEEFAFGECTSLASVTIPNSVTSIGGGAFHICTSLASVTIPNSVTSIGEGAFFRCASLASVTFQGTIASTGFDSDAFYQQGDLRDKFYVTDAANGTPGTYTRTVPGDRYSVWTKQ